MSEKSQLQDILHRLDCLESSYAITQLRARYCQALDDGRWEDLADTFTPDGAFVGLSTARGRAQMLEFFPALNSSTVTAWWHFSSNETVEFIDRDNAEGTTWLLQPCVVEGEPQIAAGRYEDIMTRDVNSGEWKFVERKVSFFFWTDLSEGWAPADFGWEPAKAAADARTVERMHE